MRKARLAAGRERITISVALARLDETEVELKARLAADRERVVRMKVSWSVLSRAFSSY